ncbi:hypothetical protein A1Q1_07884 [Trichosporon asahii var. asahii CBS 2479]|uniref:Uncharacterized protein n=1 Tax=Trichosporon asahii var. asahii (strain ATCC 90039 / CBS 2479 / JCM 2466 / KCTC 7840 / NBRC 103889/ NCYC 2677 / UAMH 7654) TaxID=1186058 RepID=J5TH88_TRIAS|nr:hypothetical protein A1Q1_07884 [Trichosporon asahii var. asahii CBS 2479]EJT50911.1 hypothetical protein A1Q1_07884 [Trichosporon asahii var. asahii CBS 2479]
MKKPIIAALGAIHTRLLGSRRLYCFRSPERFVDTCRPLEEEDTSTRGRGVEGPASLVPLVIVGGRVEALGESKGVCEESQRQVKVEAECSSQEVARVNTRKDHWWTSKSGRAANPAETQARHPRVGSRGLYYRVEKFEDVVELQHLRHNNTSHDTYDDIGGALDSLKTTSDIQRAGSWSPCRQHSRPRGSSTAATSRTSATSRTRMCGQACLESASTTSRSRRVPPTRPRAPAEVQLRAERECALAPDQEHHALIPLRSEGVAGGAPIPAEDIPARPLSAPAAHEGEARRPEADEGEDGGTRQSAREGEEAEMGEGVGRNHIRPPYAEGELEDGMGGQGRRGEFARPRRA